MDDATVRVILKTNQRTDALLREAVTMLREAAPVTDPPLQIKINDFLEKVLAP